MRIADYRAVTIQDILPQPPWEGPPVPKALAILDKVRATTYYHGFPGESFIKDEIYFTSDRDLAISFAIYRPTEEAGLVTARLDPQYPFISPGPVSGAKRLGLHEEYKAIVPDKEDTDALIRGESFISQAIRSRGHDAWIRLDGDMVVVYDPAIINVINIEVKEVEAW